MYILAAACCPRHRRFAYPLPLLSRHQPVLPASLLFASVARKSRGPSRAREICPPERGLPRSRQAAPQILFLLIRQPNQSRLNSQGVAHCQAREGYGREESGPGGSGSLLNYFNLFLYYLFISAEDAEGDRKAVREAPHDEGEGGGVAVLPQHQGFPGELQDEEVRGKPRARRGAVPAVPLSGRPAAQPVQRARLPLLPDEQLRLRALELFQLSQYIRARFPSFGLQAAEVQQLLRVPLPAAVQLAARRGRGALRARRALPLRHLAVQDAALPAQGAPRAQGLPLLPQREGQAARQLLGLLAHPLRQAELRLREVAQQDRAALPPQPLQVQVLPDLWRRPAGLRVPRLLLVRAHGGGDHDRADRGGQQGGELPDRALQDGVVPLHARPQPQRLPLRAQHPGLPPQPARLQVPAREV